MKRFESCRISMLVLEFVVYLPVAAMLVQPAISSAGSDAGRPIADAGLSRYAATDSVQLDGTGSYDPDNSGPLTYEWQQIAGPSVVIADADTATPTISTFIQTDEIQECEFELVVSDGELTSLPDTVEVIIVRDLGTGGLEQENPPFKPNKPTVIYFGGCWEGQGGGPWERSDWADRANIISFPTYPDPRNDPTLEHRLGDMIIVYLSKVAPNYNQPIQTIGWSCGGRTSINAAIHLNLTYADVRYAVNRVTFLDVFGGYSASDYAVRIDQLLASPVDGEQCWVDNYESAPSLEWLSLNGLSVYSGSWSHRGFQDWYALSLTGGDMNQFNNGVIAGAYWSVVGPGKNLQLAPAPGTTYTFQWHGTETSGNMDFFDESSHPGRLPEPVTLLAYKDSSEPTGALLTCEESENAVGYQLLLGADPYRVMDYNIISDTPIPPTEIITTFPFEETWWTIRAYDKYGSTIYADPICVNLENLSLLPLIDSLTNGKRYPYIQYAINDANDGDEIAVGPGIYQEEISFKSKNLTLRSTDPNDPSVVASTVIEGDGQNPVVTFSGGEDANCVLVGFTITRGKRGIYCSGSSPTITNCTITKNVDATMGGGICLENGGNTTLTNCTIINNSSFSVGGGMYCQNSSPILTNCTFSDNSASFSGGGICLSGGRATLTNCILWGDNPDEIQDFTGASTMTYSDIQGGFPGEGNIDIDPLFDDPNKGDYHLKSEAGRWDPNSQTWILDDVTSPCIDAGDPNSDWSAELWPHGKRINIGAFGGTPQASMSLSTVGNVADFNTDDVVNGQDLLMLTNMWLCEDVLLAEDTNRDGLVNLLDLAILAKNWLCQQP